MKWIAWQMNLFLHASIFGIKSTSIFKYCFFHCQLCRNAAGYTSLLPFYGTTVIITLLYRVSAGVPLSVTARMICMDPALPNLAGITNVAFGLFALSIFRGSPVLAVEMVNVPASP
jgi:hypothetical protein